MRVQLKAETALRGAFLLQILSEIFNNATTTCIWVFFFAQFKTINGWTIKEFIGLQGIGMLICGLISALNSGLAELTEHVDRGSFDGFMLKPISLIPQLASSKIDVDSIGDFLFGLTVTVWYIVQSGQDLPSIIAFAASVFIGCVIFWCFLFLPSLLAFYIFGADQLAGYISCLFVDIATYPSGIINGLLRNILLVGFPVLFMGAVQVDVIREVNWSTIALGAVVAAAWLLFSLMLFRYSVRRYESANLIGAR